VRALAELWRRGIVRAHGRASTAFAAPMRPFSTGGAYLNFTHEVGRVRDASGNAEYARLGALKDKYDPTNLFRLKQSIRPSQAVVPPTLA
jgi:FAD/FMN-containing dehydrogenase